MPPSTPCLEEEQIAALLCGELDAASLARAEAHLDECADCMLVVGAAAQGDSAEPPERSRSLPTAGALVAGKYRLEEPLGRGGMGVVWGARHVKLEHRVAIKFLTATDASASQRFFLEAKASAHLLDEHIARVFDFGQLPNGAPYLVMEYLVGQDLSKVIAEGPVPRASAVEYVLQACAGLERAHAAGIVHRDLKPSNLFLAGRSNGSPLVKVLDFGIAKFGGQGDLRASRSLTEPEALIGSPLYMSPEQFSGSQPLDGRSDIWATGVILYELLTRRRPFEAPTIAGLLVAISTKSPAPPSSIVEMPVELEAVVLRCLEKDPAARFESVAALANALRRSVTAQSAVEAPYGVQSPRHHDLAQVMGRQPELESLQQALQQAQSGSARLVFLTGEAGIGKTTLLRGARSLSRELPQPVLAGSGRCFEHSGSSEPYLPFLELLGAWLQGPDATLVRSLSKRHAPTWSLQFPASFGREEQEELRRETKGADRERMLREFGDLLAALAEQRCVLLMLEDLHWADSSSVDQVRLLCRRAELGVGPGQRWLIVATFRSEALVVHNPPLARLRADSRTWSQCEELPLVGWNQEQLSAYVASRFPGHQLPSQFIVTLAARTEGHPLFAVRLLDLLVERGDLRERQGAWELGRSQSDVALDAPSSVSTVIARQVEALPELDRRALQYASVEGAEFSSGVLAALLDEDELELEERLARLERSYALIATRKEEQLSPGRFTMRYGFSHALFQEHLYAELTHRRKRYLHRRAAEALIAQYPNDSLPAAALAWHFERAGDLVRASQYLLRTAEDAERAFAFREAAQLYERSAQLLGAGSASDRPPHYARLCEKLGWIRYELRYFRGAEAAFETLLAHGEGSADSNVQLEALVGLCFAGLSALDYGVTRVRIERGLAVARDAHNSARESELLALRGVREANVGEFDSAARDLEEALGTASRLNHLPTLVLGVDCLAFLYFRQSDYARAEAACRQVLGLELHPRVIIANRFRRGVVLSRLGRISEGLEEIEVAIQLARRKMQIHSLLTFPIAVGEIHRELGNLEVAIELHRAALARLQEERADAGEEPRVRWAPFHCLLQLGHDYVLAGRTAQARDEAARASEVLMDLRRGSELPSSIAEAELALGLLELELEQKQDSREARAELEHLGRRLLELAAGLSAPDDAVRVRLSLARWALRVADTSAAREQIEAALEVLGSSPLPLLAWRAQALLATTCEREGQRARAERARDEAAKLLGQVARGIADPELRRRFLSTKDACEVLADLDGAAAFPAS